MHAFRRSASKDGGDEPLRAPCRRIAALACVFGLLAPGCAAVDGTGPKGNDMVEVQVGSATAGTSELNLGVTHTQFSADPDNDPAAVGRSRALLSSRKLIQNQHIMGWGALSPQPSPRSYDWNSLDSRIDLVRQTSGMPVITLCCAPDWMKGGTPGETDWSKIDLAPAPEHYVDFAALAAEVAKRYPDVKHYQVWQGLKGFYRPDLRRWDYEGYTELYNLVYRELKKVDAEIAVGGPSVTMDSFSDARTMTSVSGVKGEWGVIDQRALDALDHWLRHNEGADFITLDIPIANKDKFDLTNPFDSTAKFGAIAAWVRERSDLPLWAARWQPFPGAARDWGQARQGALLAASLVRMISSGVDVALLWQPQARGRVCAGCLWLDTRVPGGGQPTLLLASMDAILTNFPRGTPLVDTKVSSADVIAISSPEVTVLINKLAQPLVVKVNDLVTELDSYEVRVVTGGVAPAGGGS
jgi:hypothetical protein